MDDNSTRTGQSKDYIITAPNGSQTAITNLSKFCRDNKLTMSKMRAVAGGKAKAHKGYTVTRTMK